MRALLLVLAAFAASPVFAQTLPLTIPECNCEGGAGAGTISAVGDVATGAAFNGAAGTVLTFNDADGDQTVTYDMTNNRFVVSDDVQIPAASGSSVSLRIGTTDTGLKDATGAGQLTIRVDGTDRADFVSGLGWRLLNTPNIYWGGTGDAGSQVGNRFNFGGGNGLRIYGEGAGGTEQYVGVVAGDFSTVSRGLATYRRVEVTTAGSGAPRVLNDSSDVGRNLTNAGATARVYTTLPGAAAGINYTWLTIDADGWRITAATGDTIRIGSVVSTSGGYCEASALGDAASLIAVGVDDWIALSFVGTWLCF